MLLFPEEPSRYYPDGQWSLRLVLWDGPDARGLLELGCFGLERPVVVEAGAHIYIFEFMLDVSAEAAFNQIRDKEYWLKHRAEGKDIMLVDAPRSATSLNGTPPARQKWLEPSPRNWHVGPNGRNPPDKAVTSQA